MITATVQALSEWPGALWARLPQRHAHPSSGGLPGAFISAFFSRARLLIETITLSTGLGLLGFPLRARFAIIRVVFATLYIFSLIRAYRQPAFRFMYTWIRSAHRLRSEGMSDMSDILPRPKVRKCATRTGAPGCRRSTSVAWQKLQGQPARATWSPLDLPIRLSSCHVRGGSSTN